MKPKAEPLTPQELLTFQLEEQLGSLKLLKQIAESLLENPLPKSKEKAFKKRDVEKAFIRMLARTGGGYKYSGWIDSEEGKDGERSDLSKQTGADWCVALYGSDFKHHSHFVAYVGVIRLDGTLRIKAEIDYFEHIGSDISPFVGTSSGQTVSSTSLRIDSVKGFHHKGSGEALQLLYNLIEKFDKNIGEL